MAPDRSPGYYVVPDPGFSDANRREAAEAIPRLVCPVCAGVIVRLDVQNSYVGANGEVTKVIPLCPVADIAVVPFFYTGLPCGCRLPNEWAGAWSAEMNRRLDGRTPRAVSQLSPRTRDRLIRQYEQGLARLRLYADNSSYPTAGREAARIWMAIVADQVQRLHPGDHNRAGGPNLPAPEPPSSDGFGYAASYPLPRRTVPPPLTDPAAEQAGRPADLSETFAAYNRAVANAQTDAGDSQSVVAWNAITALRWGGSTLLDEPTTARLLAEARLTPQDVRAAYDFLVRTATAKAALAATLPEIHRLPGYVSYLFGSILEELQKYARGQIFYLSRDSAACLRALVASGAVAPSGTDVVPRLPEVAGPSPVPPPTSVAPKGSRHRRQIRKLNG